MVLGKCNNFVHRLTNLLVKQQVKLILHMIKSEGRTPTPTTRGKCSSIKKNTKDNNHNKNSQTTCKLTTEHTHTQNNKLNKNAVLLGKNPLTMHELIICLLWEWHTHTCSICYELRMYLWWSLWTLCLRACQVRVTVGDSGLCCCIRVRYFKR